MKKTNVCEITEEFLREMGYHFTNRNTWELFVAFVNLEFRECVAKALIESLTSDQKDVLSSGCANETELMSQFLSMIQSSEDLPQVEMVVMRSWRSFCENLKSQKEQIMIRFSNPCVNSHNNQQMKTLNPIIPYGISVACKMNSSKSRRLRQ